MTRLRLPVHDHVSFVLVRPHYPENVGACARAIKTMGFDDLVLVRPSRLAVPEHEMAFKMSVRAWDVLASARRDDDLDDVLARTDNVLATSSHRGLSGVLTARAAASLVVSDAARGRSTCILFGNEKTGLSADDMARATHLVRIPMVGDQPSINLAQSVQLVAYELFVTALEQRGARDGQ
jgi:TrmH family RNA methyltransferase